MKWLRIEHSPEGIRIYIFGKRFHHLEAGLILIFIGFILVVHDWIFHEKEKAERESVGVGDEEEGKDIRVYQVSILSSIEVY